jgi:transposase
MQGKKHYTEKLFTSFQLSDRVPEDNFYRRLKQHLDLDFLRSETNQYYGTEGQKSIDPIVFFKLILIGYFENLNSDRKIINHVSMRLDILYFLGYDIDEELPWHSTISRTRGLYGEEVFRKLFKTVLSLCVKKGMVAGKRQAIDSAFIKANASLDSVAEKEVIADSDEFLDELEDNDDNKVKASKKAEVEYHHSWKEKTYKDQPGKNREDKDVDEFGNIIRPRYLSNHTHYSTTDRDARISVKPGKPRQFNYTAQTSVDTQSHVITNIMADFSDKKDSSSLPQVIKQTKENLEENGLKLEEVLADAGYSSGSALANLKANNIVGYIPNFGLYKPDRPGFIKNKELNQYECGRGNKATIVYKGERKRRDGNENVYRSSERVCGTCEFREACCGKNTRFKKITETVDKHLYDEMHERLKSQHAKRMKVQRSSTVEPVLGTLINFTGMRRIWTRGIKNANKFVLGAAIAYNLKKWINWQDINKKLTRDKQTKVEKPLRSKQPAHEGLLQTLQAPKNTQLIFLN